MTDQHDGHDERGTGETRRAHGTHGARTNMVNAYDPRAGGPADIDPADRDLLGRRQRTMGPIADLFYQRPVHVVRGRGVHLFGPDGADYLDCYNNLACVGHANPVVTAAVISQLERVNTHTRYLNERPVEYAERLLATFPDGLDRVVFTNSGSEANDLALRMARIFTGHQGVLVTANAYHGVTDLVSSVSPSFGTALPAPPFRRTIEVADVLADPGPDALQVLAERAEAAAADLERAGIGVGALLVDQIANSEGVLPEPRGWVRALADVAHAHGAVVLADEVQSGFGRTGDAMWGFVRHGVDADIATLGKPMANGIPAGAVVVREEIASAFAQKTRYFNTFGGNPVAMAAAGAVLDEIEDRGLVAGARTVGDVLGAGVREVGAGRAHVGPVRWAGLFLGVDIIDEDGAPDRARALVIIAALRDRRVLISGTGPAGNTLKIRPPLVFAREDADRFLETLDDVARTGLLG